MTAIAFRTEKATSDVREENMTELLSGLVAEPGRVTDVPDAARGALLVEITVLQARLASLAEAILIQTLPRAAEQRTADRLLQVDEAAALLGVDARWIRRRARVLPFVRRLSGKAIRISEDGLRRWVAARRVG